MPCHHHLECSIGWSKDFQPANEKTASGWVKCTRGPKCLVRVNPVLVIMPLTRLKQCACLEARVGRAGTNIDTLEC